MFKMKKVLKWFIFVAFIAGAGLWFVSSSFYPELLLSNRPENDFTETVILTSTLRDRPSFWGLDILKETKFKQSTWQADFVVGRIWGRYMPFSTYAKINLYFHVADMTPLKATEEFNPATDISVEIGATKEKQWRSLTMVKEDIASTCRIKRKVDAVLTEYETLPNAVITKDRTHFCDGNRKGEPLFFLLSSTDGQPFGEVSCFTRPEALKLGDNKKFCYGELFLPWNRATYIEFPYDLWRDTGRIYDAIVIKLRQMTFYVN